MTGSVCSAVQAAAELRWGWIWPIVARDLVGSYAICFAWEYVLYTLFRDKLAKYKVCVGVCARVPNCVVPPGPLYMPCRQPKLRERTHSVRVERLWPRL